MAARFIGDVNRRVQRRRFLRTTAHGFGSIALASLWAPSGLSSSNATVPSGLHHPAKAKNIVFLYMDGGPSQVDTFDYKPSLVKYHGRNPREVFKVEPTQFDNIGTVMQSPWKFSQDKHTGRWVSSLFPFLAQQMDKLAFIYSMTSPFPEHTSANYFLHTGSGIQGRPSMGAWLGYGVGSEAKNLPGFVVLNGGLIPPGGLDNFGSGFLPAAHQASIFKPAQQPVVNIQPLEKKPGLQRKKLDALRQLDELTLERWGTSDEMEAAIDNWETAYQMQTSVPQLVDIETESANTKKLYGLEASFEPTRIFGRQCLLARRLVQSGVRFVELTCPNVGGDRWDQHGELRQGHEKNSLAVDQPIAALLHDLEQTGLLAETLVVWAGEFGRTPFAQGSDGRDHNPFGFTIWLAGGGVKAGASHGATDEWGYKAVQDRVEIHDLHATMLHLLGIDHKRLTFRFGGRDMRLTDVHGRLIQGVLG